MGTDIIRPSVIISAKFQALSDAALKAFADGT
jgi:hypothetical protein